jgi:hypothetical protein
MVSFKPMVNLLWFVFALFAPAGRLDIPVF